MMMNVKSSCGFFDIFDFLIYSPAVWIFRVCNNSYTRDERTIAVLQELARAFPLSVHIMV